MSRAADAGRPAPSLTGDIDPIVLWAKWPRKKEATSYHPLLCHLIDVAVVTRLLWSEVLSPAARRRFADALGVSEATAGVWVAFWAGLHDLGKAAPTFQFLVPPAEPQLLAAGLRNTASDQNKPAHGTISAYVLSDLLSDEFGLDPALARRVAVSVGGHHGAFPTSDDLNRAPRDNVGKWAWRTLRRTLAQALAAVLAVPRDELPHGLDNRMAMALAGLVSVADWIGSNEDFFTHAVTDRAEARPIDPAAYLVRAKEQARRALATLGWLGWAIPTDARTFAQLFPDLAAYTPYPAQRAAIELANEGLTDEPGIAIVEAPMGAGKTEAALFLADRWGVSLGARGAYIALPTQATSDQMFGRVRSFLAARYPEDLVNLQLLHGHAALSATFREMQAAARRRIFAPQGIYGPAGGDGAEPNVVAAEWFTHRKRALLAPFGVGTVDQALLAVLQTRHVFVRLFGLAAKTVVVDEVHAYDAYMTTLLERLLEWLGALGSPVVLLSATLPRARRQALVAAYARGAGWKELVIVDTKYPRLTWATASGVAARPLNEEAGKARELAVTWLLAEDCAPPVDGGPFPLGERLRAALADGGCAAIICNTVRRAQAVYQALKPYFPDRADDGDPELDLLHARFLYADRQARELRTRRRFEKPGNTVTDEEGKVEPVRRPHRAILVATQIIEQSLDLDFDLMVTDLAPADLVLQRAGRLQRHERGNARPERFRRERPLWIVAPGAEADGTPAFDRGSKAVYDEHILLRSWLALRDRVALVLPGDIEETVEAVYDDARPCPDPALEARWQETRHEYEAAIEDEEEQAARRYIQHPDFAGGLDRLVDTLREEDAPELHPSHQALTRLIEQTVTLICLPANGQHDFRRAPTVAEAIQLLRRSVTVADKSVVYTLLAEPAPEGWTQSPLLRHHRLLLLDAAHGAMRGSFRLELHDELGLLIGKREERQMTYGDDTNA